MEWIPKLCALSLLSAVADTLLPEGKLRSSALAVIGLMAVRMIVGCVLIFTRQIV